MVDIRHIDSNGFWSYELELQSEWNELNHDKKELIIKYMKLLKRFKLDQSKVSFENKKWILQNCDCEISLVPLDIMRKYLLE